MKKVYFNFFLIMIVLAFGVFLSFAKIPQNIKNDIVEVNSFDNAARKSKINDFYDLQFKLNKINTTMIDSYTIDREHTTLDEVEKYRNMFDMNQQYNENDDEYIFENEKHKLIIYKKTKALKYYVKQFENKESAIKSKDEIIEIAKLFLKTNNILFDYEEIILNSENGLLKLSFISMLGKYKNFSFVNEIVYDKFGNFIEINIYFVEYSRFLEVKTKTIKETCIGLPVEIENENKIYLNDCQLVYVYEDSILQPAYYFTGETVNGRGFECFINATDFKGTKNAS